VFTTNVFPTNDDSRPLESAYGSHMPIVPMNLKHKHAVAELHRISIRTGLIAGLGQRFCEQLYWGMANTPYSFVLVVDDDQQNTMGFVCATSNASKMYSFVLMKRCFHLFFSVIHKLIRPSVILSAIKSILRPRTLKKSAQPDWDLPDAEIISIAVRPESQGRNIGTQLLKAALKRLKQMNCDRVHVVTSDDNEKATAFYMKHGFKLLGKKTHHSWLVRIFVLDLR